MKRVIFSILTLSIAFMSAFAMTDKEVVNYIKMQSAAGKSEQQISRELLAKGVTKEQVMRIKAQYEGSSNAEAKTGIAAEANAANNDVQRGVTSRDITLSEEEIAAGKAAERRKEAADKSDRIVYGRDLFNSQALTFEPNDNIATPKNYQLGPGDEVVIDIWGTSEKHLRQTITPEGYIMIEQLGPVYLNGLSISEANKQIRNAFANRYAGVGSDATDINLTLGQVRTIQVNVLGEVMTPGTYRLSPFSTVFTALYRAGGISPIGTMRNVEVVRNGRKIGSVDIYDFLFKGGTKGNIRLQEGDQIIVPAYSQLVEATGKVKRPMFYEIKKGETLADVLQYAGGFTGDAYSAMVGVTRQTGKENELVNVEKGDFATYKLRDGDVISVGTILDRYSNRVEVQGAVTRPGMYALGSDMRTLRDLIRQADGLSEDAYTARAILYRQDEDLVPVAEAIDLAAIMNGTAPDIELKKNDVVVVSSILQLNDLGEITISGPVANPGSYPYARRMTIEDLILQAGGLRQGASKARVDVARRIVNPTATEQTPKTAEIFTFSLENGLVMNATEDFYLQPYDVVEIRTSPGYQAQTFVSVEGEVAFTGKYALQKRNERISDVIRRSGGVNPGAYLKGASVRRRLSDAEIIARDETRRLAAANATGEDSIFIAKLELEDSYRVGVDLEKALAEPGNVFDLVLQPGDMIKIPQMVSTVKISGDVLYPNTVIYQPGMKVKDYINQAGGYGTNAEKKDVYIVYLNGNVARAGRGTKLEPGANIIVPSKPEGKPFDWTKVMALVSAFGSVVTMGATITSLFKK